MIFLKHSKVGDRLVADRPFRARTLDQKIGVAFLPGKKVRITKIEHGVIWLKMTSEGITFQSIIFDREGRKYFSKYTPKPTPIKP